jgi:hypothetical protein
MLGVLNAGHDRLSLRQNGAHAFRGLLEPPGEQSVRKDEATMIEDSGRSTTKPRNWTRFAPLLAVFALSFLTIRLLAGRSAKGYPTPPFFHLFFSDTIHMKAWLATGAITLGLFQVLSAARLFELFRCGPAGRFQAGCMYPDVAAIFPHAASCLCCIFLLGFETTSRVAIRDPWISIYGSVTQKSS